MRTKNAKRLWPVPVTLGVMALAALLAFGLMATNGAQPAAAQDDADCEIVLTDAGQFDDTPSDDACSAVGDTAVVEFSSGAAATDEANVYVLIEDTSGSIRAYPNGTGAGDIPTTTATRYTYQLVEVPVSSLDSSGNRQPGKVQISVDGNLLMWTDPTGTTPFGGVTAPITAAPDNERELTTGSRPLAITFLGMPALSKDLDDFNDEIDNEDWMQCVVDSTPGVTADDAELAMSTKLVGEHATDCTSVADVNWLDSTAVDDETETRSKLVVRLGAADSTTAAARVLLSGKELTQTVSDTDQAVTIYALVQDAKGNNLLDTGVDFTAVTNPSGIVSDRELSDDPVTKSVVDDTPTDADEQIEVQGLANAVADALPNTALIAVDDAVAAFTLKDLHEIDGAFSITVNVTAGDLNMGSVVITRPDAPESIVAGVFDNECFTAGGDENDDYSEATFEAVDDCDDSGMGRRFGHEEMIFVKAHLEDSLGNVVGESDDLDAELAEDDDLIGDGDPITIEEPVEDRDEPRAWLYTVDEDASLGEHTITVSTDVQNADEEDIDDVTLTVTIAGPPSKFSIEGPERIDLGGSGTFTVTATDAIDAMPYFKDDASKKHNVFIQGLVPGNVRGLDSSSNVTLNDYGMDTFTIYAPPGSAYGATVRIFIGSGENEVSHTVTFGGNRAPVAGAAIADAMVYTGETATATSTITDADGDMLTWSVVSDDEMTATATVDAGTVTITGVAPGSATITVTATDPDGETGTQMINVTVADMPMDPESASDLTAMANGDGTVTLEWDLGANANTHFVAGTSDSGATYSVWEFATEDGTFTSMAGDLTIGTEYSFWIRAGQFEQDARGNWMGDWAADGWSNGATATPMMSSTVPPPPPPPGG